MITVLRLFHRPERDKRLTTHVALTARAFGADEMVYSGIRDANLEESVHDVVSRWGGNFKVRFTESWKDEIKGFAGLKIHLTMYGLNVDDVINEIRANITRDVLVIVGGEKVPAVVYNFVDYNVAIGNQPHSEVAALAVLLDRLFSSKELKKEFEGARVRIIPQEKGKRLEEQH